MSEQEFIQMNEEGIPFTAWDEDFELYFFMNNYKFGNGPAITCEEPKEGPFADVSENLWGYSCEPNQIYLNHDLEDDFKEMFVENFCVEESLDDCEEVDFGNFGTKTQLVTIRDEFFDKIPQ